MLFNSHEFIFLFLPIVLVVFSLLSNHYRLALIWLTVASLFFYAWWSPPYVLFILASVIFNYLIGSGLKRFQLHKKTILVLGLVVNLGLLAYYKYTHFLLQTWNQITDSNYQMDPILLPLAISFFTFAQISYIVDMYRSDSDQYSLLDYLFFVVFFPHLIAGPIVKHDEIIPQVKSKKTHRLQWEHLAVGLTIFCVGLFKKVIIADQVSILSNGVFNLPASQTLTFAEAWIGTFAYALQIYFDFSGYSDMAIGLSYCFGIKFPMNFFSPYQANSIIEFWRRWHMTLSRFLRDYLYISLGGNRSGLGRRHINLMLTMLLGGLWHGAGWTFVIWGGLHGAYLIINHTWRSLPISKTWEDKRLWLASSRILTFLAVCLAWVFFRATSADEAFRMTSAMFGIKGFSLSMSNIQDIKYYRDYVYLGIAIAFWVPNVYIWMERFEPVLLQGRELNSRMPPWLKWSPAPAWAVAAGLVFLITVLLINKESPFLYFQF